MERCRCGWLGICLTKHLAWSPGCNELAPDERCEPRAEIVQQFDPPKPTRSGSRFHDASFDHMLRHQVAAMHLTGGMLIEHIKKAVALTESAMAQVSKRVLSTVQQAGVPALEAELKQILDAAARSINNLADVRAVCDAQTQGALHPLERPMDGAGDDKKHFCFFSVKQQLCDLIQNDDFARGHILRASKDWSTLGKYYRQPAETLTDITSGNRFRWSRLARPAEPSEQAKLRVRIGLDGWNDDFTVSSPVSAPLPAPLYPIPSSNLNHRSCQAVCPIGTRRKEHKYGVFTLRIINLPPVFRDDYDNVLLNCIYQVKRAKSLGGTCRMICGIDGASGKAYSEMSFRSDMLELMEGIPLEIPDDVNGGKMSIILEACWLGLSGDLLGVAGFGPWPESFTAQHPCLDCWWHSSCFCARLPLGSRELQRRPTSAHSPGCRGRMELRTEAELQQAVQRVRGTTYRNKKARADDLRDFGLNTVHSAIQHIPGAIPTRDARKDTMHLFWAGISRHEGYWMIDDQVTKGNLTWEGVDGARKNLSLPKGHKIPTIYNPKKDGTAKASTSLNLKSAEMMHFVCHR